MITKTAVKYAELPNWIQPAHTQRTVPHVDDKQSVPRLSNPNPEAFTAARGVGTGAPAIRSIGPFREEVGFVTGWFTCATIEFLTQ